MEAEALVYVVDDDASLRASLQDLLESVGLRVAACVQRCPAAWCSMCGCQASAGWSCLWTALLPTAHRPLWTSVRMGATMRARAF
jgi:hypothetical protein